MSDWKVLPLGDLVVIHDSRRIPLSKAERSRRQGPFPYYGAQGVIDHIDDFIFDGRYVLVPEDGENLRSRKSHIAYFAEGKFWVNNHAHIISAAPDVAIDRFIQSAIQATDIGAFVTGAAQPKLSQASLKRIELRIPDLKTQETIGDILDSLDDLIENNRRRIELLEEMAQAIYREWFVHFRFPGHENAAFVDSPLGPIPEDWEARTFGDLVDLEKTTVDPNEIPAGSVLVGLEHIPRRQLTLDSWEESCEVGSRKARFAKGDILFGKIRPYFHKVSIAPTDGYCSPDALVFRAKPSLEALAASTAFSKAFVDLASTTSNGLKMPRASWEVLASHPVAVPPPSLLETFTDLFTPSITKCQVLMYENKSLESIRDLLLPKLVSGEIDVSQLDLDAVLGGAV